MKFLVIILLLFQSGRYQIDSINNKQTKGTVTLTPYSVTIKDTTTTVLPVTRVVKDKQKTFYFIEGTENNVNYRGAATLYRSGSTTYCDRRIRTVYLLKIELRSQQNYYKLRYIIYHEN